jgi:hypothetical protein
MESKMTKNLEKKIKKLKSKNKELKNILFEQEKIVFDLTQELDGEFDAKSPETSNETSDEDWLTKNEVPVILLSDKQRNQLFEILKDSDYKGRYLTELTATRQGQPCWKPVSELKILGVYRVFSTGVNPSKEEIVLENLPDLLKKQVDKGVNQEVALKSYRDMYMATADANGIDPAVAEETYEKMLVAGTNVKEKLTGDKKDKKKDKKGKKADGKK